MIHFTLWFLDECFIFTRQSKGKVGFIVFEIFLLKIIIGNIEKAICGFEWLVWSLKTPLVGFGCYD